MGMQKSLSKTKHFNLFYLFFFINIYNIVVVFVFSYPFPPPPQSVPNKKNVSKLGRQVSIQIPFCLISLNEPYPEQRFVLPLRGLYGWKSELNHTGATGVPHIYPVLGGDLTKDEGLLSTVSGTLLGTRGDFLLTPKPFIFICVFQKRWKKSFYVRWLWLVPRLGLLWLTDWLEL